MKYIADMNNIKLADYREMLKAQFLLPSRKALRDNIDDIFSKIFATGIVSLGALLKQLSTKDKIAAYSLKTGIDSEYLTLLRREAGSLEPKALSLTEYPGICEAAAKLADLGVKNGKDYFDRYYSDKNLFSESIGRELAEEIFLISGLTRINGLGALAAKSFLEAGYKTPQDIADATSQEMLIKLSEVNSDGKYYKAKLGLKDMQFCIDYAKLLIMADKLANNV
jgi:hypothetical protein